MMATTWILGYSALSSDRHTRYTCILIPPLTGSNTSRYSGSLNKGDKYCTTPGLAWGEGLNWLGFKKKPEEHHWFWSPVHPNIGIFMSLTPIKWLKNQMSWAPDERDHIRVSRHPGHKAPSNDCSQDGTFFGMANDHSIWIHKCGVSSLTPRT